jgi:hypothetical protein
MNLRLLGHWDGLQWQDLVVTEKPSHSVVGTYIVEAKGRTGLQGNDSKLTLREIYPVWPRNDAFPQLLISKYCIRLHRYAVR